MSDELLLGLYVLLIGNLALFFLSQLHLHRSINDLSDRIKDKISDIDEEKGGFVDEMKDIMAEIVEDTLSTMRPPDASDHLAGALGQIAQMWAFKRFGNPAQMLQQALGGEPEPESQPEQAL